MVGVGGAYEGLEVSVVRWYLIMIFLLFLIQFTATQVGYGI